MILQRKCFGLISTVKNAFTSKKKFLKSKEKYVDHLKGQFSKDFDKLSPEARKEAFIVSDLGGSSDVKGVAAKHGLDNLDSYKRSEKYNKLLNDKISSINRDRWKLAGGAVVAAGLGYGAKKLYDRYKRKKQEKESKEKQFSFLGRIGRAVGSAFRSTKKEEGIRDAALNKLKESRNQELRDATKEISSKAKALRKDYENRYVSGAKDGIGAFGNSEREARINANRDFVNGNSGLITRDMGERRTEIDNLKKNISGKYKSDVKKVNDDFNRFKSDRRMAQIGLGLAGGALAAGIGYGIYKRRKKKQERRDKSQA